MKRFLSMLANALLTALTLLGLIILLIWLLEEPIYGTQPQRKPIPHKPAVYRVMT